MERLRNADLIETIRSLRQPLLGVCVGMQLLFESSEEGDVPCLGLLPGRVRRFADRDDLPVPHMGWNQLEFARALAAPRRRRRAAITSTSCTATARPLSENTVATTTYGERFAAIVQQGNVYGAQFHPERSARAGALVLRNFLLVS